MPTKKTKKKAAFANNKAHLSELLGVSRRTIQNASLIPGWPKPASNGTWKVESARKFLEANTAALDDSNRDIGSLKKEIAAEQARKLRLANEETEGRLTDTEKLSRLIGPILSNFKDLIYQKLGNEIPIAMAGVDVPQARIIGNRYAGELLEKMQRAFQKWDV